MSFMKKMVDQLKQKVFQSVVENNLVYNTCWEDPAIDRRILDLKSDSRLVTLTSAGCNALNYLLDKPARIYCVDINAAQNALLELKLALFRQNKYSLLWNMFGLGSYLGASVLYHNELRSHLSVDSRGFWDRHIRYFSPSASTPSFYFCGTAGTFAYIIHERLKQKGLLQATNKMLDSASLQEQQYYFAEIKPHLWNSFSKWLLTRNATMALLGVPAGQGGMIDDEINGGLPLFIQNSIEEVFTNHSLAENYFWRVYLTAHIHPTAALPILKRIILKE